MPSRRREDRQRGKKAGGCDADRGCTRGDKRIGLIEKGGRAERVMILDEIPKEGGAGGRELAAMECSSAMTASWTSRLMADS